MKFVVRENQTGNMGSFETDIQVPDLRKAPLKMSSVVVASQRLPDTDEACAAEIRWCAMGWSGFRMWRMCFGRTSIFTFCTRCMTRREMKECEGRQRGEAC